MLLEDTGTCMVLVPPKTSICSFIALCRKYCCLSNRQPATCTKPCTPQVSKHLNSLRIRPEGEGGIMKGESSQCKLVFTSWLNNCVLIWLVFSSYDWLQSCDWNTKASVGLVATAVVVLWDGVWWMKIILYSKLVDFFQCRPYVGCRK